MGWLRDTFPEPRNNSTEVEKIRYARAYILEIIRGYLMPNLSRNLVYLRWLLKLVDFRAAGEFSWGSAVLATLYWEMCGAMPQNKGKIRGCLSLLQSWVQFYFQFLRSRVNHPYTFPLITRWNHLASYIGIPTALEDIPLLLDQQPKAQFQWTPYEDPAIRTPEVLDKECKIDLQQTDTNWPEFFSEYIKIWKNRYHHIPARESIIVPKLACALDYMPWFRIHDKPYLLSEEQKHRQIRVKRK
ncbi:hypothetical protein CXB51_033782 [Gossypium anomalum]|uniref:Aminotransferase-like plant mobile domain-containing protein n=1 Tax=Gossypium anomalum TaxID=47600 RepID=A0A8J5YB91_9ROSI|nr:hypothetical protein CXB51_033782 [Gossypium anomalum]